MRKLAVVGAKGMLGAELVRQLRAACPDDEITCADVEDIDITVSACADSEELKDASIIFNCAAYTAVDKAESEPARAFAVNATGVRNLARAAEKNNSLLVHISTDFVFSGPFVDTIPVDAAPAPISIYGKSKLEGERILQNSTIRHLIVRTAWLYGPGGNNFVEAIYKKASAGENLRVIADQYGAPTYTVDLAGALIGLCEKGAEGVYHCTNSGHTTWHGFASAIVKLSGLDVSVKAIGTEEYPTPARRPSYSVLDLSKTVEVLGRPMRPWIEGLRDYLALTGRLPE